jgi:hypothetical protein
VSGLPVPPGAPRGGLRRELDAELDGAEAPPSPPSRRVNPPGVAALLAGLAAVVCANVPDLAVLALPAAVAAILLGGVGIARARAANWGRVAAGAGIALGVVAAVLAVAWLVLLATEGEFAEGFREGFREALRDEGGVFALRPGDCFDLPDTTSDVATLPLVACDEPHDAEVFATIEHPAAPDDPFPTPRELLRFAYAECDGERFTRYVGAPLEESPLDMDVIYPEQASWRLGERTLVCFLFDPGGPLEVPARRADL